MTNLLINSSFYDGGHSLVGWSVDNGGCWDVSYKPSMTPPPGTAAQCDQDAPGGGPVIGWPTGEEARLWQNIVLASPPSQAVFRATEVQHHGDNAAEIRLYGLVDGNWQELWSRLEFGSDVPPNTPANRRDWYTNEYVIPLGVVCTELRLEFYGRVDAGLAEGAAVGWKFTNLVLEVSD